MKLKLKITLNYILLLLLLIIPLENQAQPNFQWAKSNQGLSADEATAISTDASGNVYYAGNFEGVFDLDPSTGTSTVMSAGLTDNFIIKLDANGNFVWGKTFESVNNSYITDITTDLQNNLIIVGYFRNTIDLDPSVLTSTFTTVTNYNNAFVCKLDNNGNYIWAKTFVSSTTSYANSVDTDTFLNIYIGGVFVGDIDLDPGVAVNTATAIFPYNTGFISRLNSTGNYLNHYSTMPGNFNTELEDLKYDKNENTLLVAAFTNSTLSATSSYAGNYDVYFEKLNPNLTSVWNKQFGGSSAEYPCKIETDINGNIYLAGRFSSNCDFDPSTTSSFSLTSFNAVYSDIFIAKFSAIGNFIWVKQMGSNSLHDYCYGMSVDNNAIYYTGTFRGVCDFNPSNTTNALTTNGGDDMYIASLDLDGNYNFAYSFGSSGVEQGNAILAVTNCIYTVGFFNNTIDFDFSTSINTHIAIGGTESIIHKIQYSNVGLTENLNQGQLLFYPNPANNKININNNLESQVTIEILGLNGALIYKTTSSKQLIEIPIEDISSGIYLLKQSDTKSSIIKKLIIK